MKKYIGQGDLSVTTYKAFMTVLFVGIVCAVLCLIFNLAYRSSGIYFSSDLINVSTLIFGVLFIFFLIGIIYSVMVSRLEKGALLFMLLFVLLTILALWRLGSVNYSVQPAESLRFRGLLKGLIWINGVGSVIGIPLLRSSQRLIDGIL